MTKAEYDDRSKASAIELMEAAVNALMQRRRMCELEESMTTEEFDKKLDEICERYWHTYSTMSKRELAIRMLSEALGD